MIASHYVDSVEFSNMLESYLNDSQTDIQAALPLLKQYLQSPSLEIRRSTLLTISVLARRPNSASELRPILPALYTHLSEADVYLRQGTLLSIATLQPEPPNDALASMGTALPTANTSDDFGMSLAETLARFQADSDQTQDAILAYLHRPDLTDSKKADAIDLMAFPGLGRKITSEIVNLANTSPAGRLRNASIDACAKIGPRAAGQIRATLDAIRANSSETSAAQAVAGKASAVLNQ